MDQLGGLLLNGFDYFRMAMAGGADGDAGGEVEEGVAVNVFDYSAMAALSYQRVVACERRRHELGILLDNLLCFWPWELRQ